MRYLKIILAIVLIGLGAAIGWYIADSSNPYKPETLAAAATPTTGAGGNAPRTQNTPIPTFTAAGAVTATTPGAGAAAGAGGQRGGLGGGQTISGTLEAYDAAAKTLTVKTVNGQSLKVGATNANILKTEKVSNDDFAKSLGANSFVLVSGEKGGDGAYDAKTMVAIDIASLFGGRAGGAGAGGFPGGGNGGNAGAGTGGNRPGGAGASGTPGAGGAAGGNGGNRAGGAGAGAGGFAGGAGGRLAIPGLGGFNGIVVRGGTLSGTKFSGTSLQGDAVTANLSDSTNLLKQVSGTATDLKAGIKVTITAQPAQDNAQPEANIITITDNIAG